MTTIALRFYDECGGAGAFSKGMLMQADEEGRVRCLAMDQTKINANGILFDATTGGFIKCIQAFAD